MATIKQAQVPPANLKDMENLSDTAPGLGNSPGLVNETGLNPLAVGPMPSLLTTTYDSIRQWLRPGAPQFRTYPLPVKAGQQVGAVAKSIVTITANTPVGSYLPLVGGTLSGPLVFATTSAPFAINSMSAALSSFAGPLSASGFLITGETPPVGHVLRSDGSIFVDAALSASDLSNGVTGSGAVVLAASPTLTGSPLAPTQLTADNSTKIATTAWVKNQSYITAASAPVVSVFGRVGAVVAAANDYSFAQLSGVRTNRTSYVISSTDFANNLAKIPVTFSSPFANTSYTVSVSLEYDTGSLAAWAALHNYIVGDFILDSNNNIQRVSAPGISGAAPPTWSTAAFGNTTDAGVTWTTYFPLIAVQFQQRSTTGVVVVLSNLNDQGIPIIIHTIATHD